MLVFCAVLLQRDENCVTSLRKISPINSIYLIQCLFYDGIVLLNVFLPSLTSPLLNVLPGPVKCTCICLYLCMNVHMSLLSLNKIWIWMHYHLRLLITVLLMWYISVFPLKWVMSEIFLVIKSHFASCSRSVFRQGMLQLHLPAKILLQNADIHRNLFIFCPSVCKRNILLV